MDRPEQSTDFESRLKQTTGWRPKKLCAALAAGLLLVMTGCQATTDRGMWRVWADANSLGGPAAFVDQMRSDGFRTDAPPNVLHDVTAINVPRGEGNSVDRDFDVIPLVDPALDVQQTSYARPQSVGSGNVQPQVVPQPVVQPNGAWLF
jgi:hypothetical protein